MHTHTANIRRPYEIRLSVSQIEKKESEKLWWILSIWHSLILDILCWTIINFETHLLSVAFWADTLNESVEKVKANRTEYGKNWKNQQRQRHIFIDKNKFRQENQIYALWTLISAKWNNQREPKERKKLNKFLLKTLFQTGLCNIVCMWVLCARLYRTFQFSKAI